MLSAPHSVASNRQATAQQTRDRVLHRPDASRARRAMAYVAEGSYHGPMASSTWAELTRALDHEDLAKITAFRDYLRSLPNVEERIHSSEIAFARQRVFTSAYIKSHYLEIGIALLREVTDPKPRTSFSTSKLVTMHRYSLRELEEFDEPIRALLREAADTVGPGTRAIRR